MPGLFIVVIAVAPRSFYRCVIENTGIRIRIKQPERNIYTFDFINMILIFKPKMIE